MNRRTLDGGSYENMASANRTPTARIDCIHLTSIIYGVCVAVNLLLPSYRVIIDSEMVDILCY